MLVVGGVRRKAGAAAIKIRALSEAAHKTKEMPLTSHFLTLEAPDLSCGVTICDIPCIVAPNELPALFTDLFTQFSFLAMSRPWELRGCGMM